MHATFRRRTPRAPSPRANTARTAASLAVLAALAGCQGREQRQAVSNSDANRPSLVAARGALSQGEAATALSIARGVLSLEPNNVAAMVQAGDAEAALGSKLNAEREYRHALKLRPDYAPALIGNAKLLLASQPAAAEIALRAVLAREPRNTAALTDLGIALDLQERHAEAQASYTAALAANPDLAAPRVNLALSLALSGNPAKAEEMLRDVAESGPVPARVRANYALAQVLAGHPEEAQKTLQADLSLDESRVSVEGFQALMPAKPKGK